MLLPYTSVGQCCSEIPKRSQVDVFKVSVIYYLLHFGKSTIFSHLSNMVSLLSPLLLNFHVEFNTRNVVLASATYLLLCQALRYSRKWYLWARYPYKDRISFAKMTANHAYEIQRTLFTCEFPFTMALSLSFALFRTYGIPSISKLLVQTKQLSDRKCTPKVRACTTRANKEHIVSMLIHM